MDRRRQLNILVVRGDGVPVLRARVSRSVVRAGLGLAAVGLLGVSLLAGDYARVQRVGADRVNHARELAEYRATVQTLNARAGELRREIESWRALHARIWEPFGPDIAPRTGPPGVGGPSEPPDARPPLAVSPADELEQLLEVARAEGESLRALDRLMARAGRALAALPSRWPVRGPVNSEFGKRRSPWGKGTEVHGGIDIGAPRGTTVRAPAPGRVVLAGRQGDLGVTVVLDHAHDVRSVYAHLSQVGVKAGQTVERGAVIGRTGNTGRSTGPHLHYEILVRGQPVNPRAFFWD